MNKVLIYITVLYKGNDLNIKVVVPFLPLIGDEISFLENNARYDLLLQDSISDDNWEILDGNIITITRRVIESSTSVWYHAKFSV